jgi:hypothetical protein
MGAAVINAMLAAGSMAAIRLAGESLQRHDLIQFQVFSFDNLIFEFQLVETVFDSGLDVAVFDVLDDPPDVTAFFPVHQNVIAHQRQAFEFQKYLDNCRPTFRTSSVFTA